GVKENGGPIVAPFETCCAKYPLDGVYSCQGNAIWLPVVGSPHGTALCLGKNKSCTPATQGRGDHDTRLALCSGLLLNCCESYNSILILVVGPKSVYHFLPGKTPPVGFSGH